MENWALLRAALSAAQVGIIILDQHARVWFWNMWMVRYSGISTDRARGLSLEVVFQNRISEQVLKGIDHALTRALTTVISHSAEQALLPLFQTHEHNNKSYPMLHSIVIKPVVFNQIRHCMLQINDVTASVYRENLLRQQGEELKTLADRYRRVNEELTQFNYRVSHDLVAPLRTIKGFLNLCGDELEEGHLDEVRTLHQRMGRHIDLLSALVRDVMDLARADAQPQERTTIDLDALINEILGKYEPSISALAFAIEVHNPVKQIDSEPLRLQQVIENLVANAIKYHDPVKAHKQIIIATEHDPDPNQLNIWVEDNGIGFDSSFGDKIFDIFTRASSKHPGSGLGLYIVKKHVDHLGGHVQVISNRNNTIFKVMLPLAEDTHGHRF